jgi:hypothetical protein
VYYILNTNLKEFLKKKFRPDCPAYRQAGVRQVRLLPVTKIYGTG